MSKFLDLDGLEYYTDKVKAKFTDIQSDISKDEASLVELVDGGAKNLLYVTPETKSIGSITFTANEDGTVDVSGTTNSTVVYMLLGTSTEQASGMVEIPVGKYYISGGLASTTNISVSVYINDSSSPNRRYYHAFATAIEFEINSGDKVTIAIRVATNNSTGKTYPMLCTKAAWDISQAYQHYRPSYQELYEQVEENENNILMLRTFMAYMGYAEIIKVEKQVDNPNRIRFYIQSYYNGDVSTIKTGGLFARSLPLNTDLTVDNAEGDFYNTTLTFNTMINDSRGDGLGVSVKPYIEISGERHYGVQQRYFYSNLT